MAVWSVFAMLVAAVTQVEQPLAAQGRPEFETYRRLLLIIAAVGLVVYVLWSVISRYRSRRRKR